MGQGHSACKPPPKVVLVPPFFERNKGRSRFTHSSYDYMFSKRSLKWLFSDYLGGEVLGKLYLSPPADPRISVKAKLGPASGSMAVRWQPDPQQEGTFIDLRASPKSPGDAAVRMCFLHLPSGLGLFGNVPVAGHLSNKYSEVGVRYSSPLVSCGAIMRPHSAAVTHVWMAGRYQDLAFGAQLRPDMSLTQLSDALGWHLGTQPGSSLPMLPAPSSTFFFQPSPAARSEAPFSSAPAAATGKAEQLAELAASGGAGAAYRDWGDWLCKSSSCCLAYSPQFSTASGRGNFTAAAEVEGGHSLRLGFYQHMALTRNVYNPLEKGDVVGITNYLDLGIQLVTPLSEDAPPSTKPGIRIAGAWQVNRGLLLKARVGSDALAVAVGLKVWGQPSLSAAACAQYTLGSWQPRIGVYLQVENFGEMLFERSEERLRRGQAVTQEHEASAEEVASFTGERIQVNAGAEPAAHSRSPSISASFL